MNDYSALLVELRTTMGKIEMALGTISDAIVWTNKDGVVQWCNSTFDRLMNRKHLYILGVNLMELLPLEQQDRAIPPDKHPLNLVLNTQYDAAKCYSFTRDNEKLALEISGSLINIDEVDMSAVFVIQDVTARIQSEAALIQSKNYSDNIIKSMLDALIVVSPDATIQKVNNAAAALLGYEEKELIGQSMKNFFVDDDLSLKDVMEKFAVDGSVKNYDFTLKTKSGEKIPISFSGSIMRDSNNKMGNMVIVARDLRETKRLISEAAVAQIEKEKRREIEHSHRQLQETLNQLKLTQDQLLQSEKMAAIGQLAGGVAHEINNPLGVILGFSQSVAEEIKEGDSLEMPLKRIVKEALRCKNLVQNLLTFSRKSQIETMDELDLNSILEGALDLILSNCKTQNIEVLKKFSIALPKILANATQLQQVLINLSNNAIDAMPDKGTLTIRTQLSKQPPHSVEILVQDTGTGIPENKKHRIFEPFYTTKEPGRGTGLGLSLIYEIIQRHNGSINLESEEGKGTTFIVRLPAVPYRS